MAKIKGYIIKEELIHRTEGWHSAEAVLGAPKETVKNGADI